jgi:hypothetical protein
MMKRTTGTAFVLLASGTLAACGGAAVSGPAISQAALGNPNYTKLQFVVGTANVYGSARPGLNVVSTLRQPDGASATGVNTPRLAGPFSFAVPAVPAIQGLADPYTSLFLSPTGTFFLQIGGPSLPEKNAVPPVITGTPQSLLAGTPACDTTRSAGGNFVVCPSGTAPNASTFGQSGGVFAMGLAPYDTVASTGQSDSYSPYAQPLYDVNGSLPLFVPWGGPPAFDPDGNGMGTRDGLVVLGVDSFGIPYELGVPEGITAWSGIVPRTGQYALTVQIGVIGSNGSQTIITRAQTATLHSLAMLPTLTAPVVTLDPNGDGGATFAVALPPGVPQALVQIVDYGPGGGPTKGSSSGITFPASFANCQGPKGASFAPVYYSIFVDHSGNYSLGPSHGPNTNLNGGVQHLTPSPSICTAAQNTQSGVSNAGDNFTVQIIGFDYPLYSAALSLTQSKPPQAPPIAGPNGQSDVTISLPVEQDWTPTGYARSPLGLRRFRRAEP